MPNHCPNCETSFDPGASGIVVCRTCTAALTRLGDRVVVVPEAVLTPEIRAQVARQREAMVDAMLSASRGSAAEVA